jgi:DNA-directed RNA polymerase specialized sigma24 family protein
VRVFERVGTERRGDGLEGQAVGRAREGDEGGVRFLYIRYARDVHRHVRATVRDDHHAETVTQEVFAQLTPSLTGYDERVLPFAEWLLRTAHDAACEWLLRRGEIESADDCHYDGKDLRGALAAG